MFQAPELQIATPVQIMPAHQFHPSTYNKVTQERRWSEIPWWQWPKEMSLGFSYSDFPGLSWVLSLFETGLVHSLKWKKIKLCLTGNPKNRSLLGSSTHGILQSRMLEWAPLPSLWGSPKLGIILVSRLLRWQAGSLSLVPDGLRRHGDLGGI